MEYQSVYFGGLCFDDQRKQLVTSQGLVQPLRKRSLQVLLYLIEHHDQVESKDEIISSVWGKIQVTDESLVQCIADIRKALGDQEHKVLKTVRGRGYLLVADAPTFEITESAQPNVSVSTKKSEARISSPQSNQGRYRGVLGLVVICALGLWYGKMRTEGYTGPLEIATDSQADRPSLSISLGQRATDSADITTGLIPELRVALNRFQSLNLSDRQNTAYRMMLSSPTGLQEGTRVAVELRNSSNSIIFANSFSVPAGTDAANTLAIRIAAAIASPGVGAVGRDLLLLSRIKPIESISEAECYANGYGCAKCSGEEDSITLRAEACLANMIESKPENARAWALQATIYAHQYWWGNTLSEPQRSDPSLRKHLPAKAVEAASRAETLSGGKDPAIYWGMAEAYYASCQSDKLYTTIKRGLELNSDDPNLLASFGNWLVYTGRSDEGVSLIEKALAIEPGNYRKWWWMGLAKDSYRKKNYEIAYRYFLKSHSERNWLSQLQLAYTLPYLGRLPEAREAVENLKRLYPGITIEEALETYKLLCFDDEFVDAMKQALIMAGLPSRGDSQDLHSIVMPRAKTTKINCVDTEYLDIGSGEPVLFVHGSMSDYRTWGYYMVPISEQYRFITYSRRYYGTQPWADDGVNYSVAQYADDLIQLIEKLDTGPVHLVTWSSGARSAIAAMVERPDLFKSAVHYEPVANNILDEVQGLDEILDEWRGGFSLMAERLDQGDAEGAASRFIEKVFSLPIGGIEKERESVQEIVRQNARVVPLEWERWSDPVKFGCEYLQRVVTPTRVLLGTETQEFYKAIAARVTECVSNSEVRFINGANHRGPIDRIEEIAGHVLEFVGQNK